MISFIEKHRMLIDYTVFGCITAVVNYGVFWLCNALLLSHYQDGYLIAHIISWIISVLFSYVVNKYFVFHATARHIRPVQFASFIFIRIVTEGFVLVAMYLLVTVLSCNEYLMKLLTDIILIIVNYVFTKYVSFGGIDEKLKSRKKPSEIESDGSSDASGF